MELALSIWSAATPLPSCWGIGSLDQVSGDSDFVLRSWFRKSDLSITTLRGVTTASNEKERTDDPVALTDDPLLRDPTYSLSERDFAVMHSLDRVLVFGRAGFGRARREFPWSLDGVGE